MGVKKIHGGWDLHKKSDKEGKPRGELFAEVNEAPKGHVLQNEGVVVPLHDEAMKVKNTIMFTKLHQFFGLF